MGMKCKEFNDYEKACSFRDKVNGEIHWGSRKDEQYWTVWYTDRSEVEDGNNDN